jgi:nitroreductase
MDIFKAILGRRSIRKFKDEPVEDDLIWKIIEAGIWAPSAGNIQSWELIIVKKPKKKYKLGVAGYMREFIGEAPVILVICANQLRSNSIYGDRGKDLYCIQDASVAAENMLLAIHALGLGACWVGSFDENIVSDVLGLPHGIRPITLIPLGYPDETPYPPPRREIEEFIHNETFKNEDSMYRSRS